MSTPTSYVTPLAPPGQYFLGVDLAYGSDRTVISKPAQSADAPGILSQAMALASNDTNSDPRQRKFKVRVIGPNEGYIKSNVEVPTCGHTMNPAEHPKHINCYFCWHVYFSLHPGITLAAKSAIETLGEDGIKRAYGKKFLRYYKRFAEGQQ